MKLRLPIQLAAAVVAALTFGAYTQNVYAESISINFGTVAMPNSDDLAGADGVAVASKNWNNALGTNGTLGDLIDSGHKNTGVSITWAAGEAGIGGTGEGDKEMGDGNKQMMGSYLDDKAGSGSSFTISNINYWSYDLYIYCSYTAGWQYAPKSVNDILYMGSGSEGTEEGNGIWGQTNKNAKEGKLQEGMSGNYLKISLNEANLSILGDVIADKWSRGGIAGIMIVDTTEGTVYGASLAGGSSTAWGSAPWKDSSGASAPWVDTAEGVETYARFGVTGGSPATVTISDAVTATGLALGSGSLNITGGILNFSTQGVISVAEGSTLSLASKLKAQTYDAAGNSTDILTKKGKGTLILTGDALMSDTTKVDKLDADGNPVLDSKGNVIKVYRKNWGFWGLNIEEGVVNIDGSITLLGGKTTTVAGELNVGGNLTANDSENHHFVITSTGKMKVNGNFITNYSPTLNTSGILEVTGTLQARGGGTTRFNFLEGSTTTADTFEINYNGKITVAGKVKSNSLIMRSTGSSLIINDKGNVESVKFNAEGTNGNDIQVNKGAYLTVTGGVSSDNYDNNSFVLASKGVKSVLTVNEGRLDALNAVLYLGGASVADAEGLKLVAKSGALLNLYGISNSLNSNVITLADSTLNVGAGGIKALATGADGKISFDNVVLGALDSWEGEKLAFEIGSKGLTVNTEKYDASTGETTGEGKVITLGGVIKSVNTEGATVGSLLKTGAGTLILKGDNSTFTGAIRVEDGGITAGHANALGSVDITLNGTDMGLDMGGFALVNNIDITGSTVIKRASQFGGNLTLNSGDVSGDALNLAAGKSYIFKGGSIANILTGSGGFIKNTEADLVLSGANDYTGATEIQAGKLVVSGSISSSPVTVKSTAGLQLTGGGSVSGNITLEAGSSLDTGAGLVLGQDQTITAVKGATLEGNLSLDGAGTLIVEDEFVLKKGVLSLNGGSFTWRDAKGMEVKGLVLGENADPDVLKLGNGNTYFIGSEGITGAGSLFMDDGILAATADWTMGINLSMADAGATFRAEGRNGDAYDITVDGVISGAGKLTKTGGGVLILNAVNEHTGGTLVRQGGLCLGNEDALGTSGILTLYSGTSLAAYEKSVSVGNTVELGAVGDTGYAVTFGQDGQVDVLTLRGDVNLLASDTTLTVLSETVLAGRVVGDTDSFTKNGSGTLTLSGSFGGIQKVNLAAGRLAFASETALSDIKTLDMTAGTTLDLGGLAGTSANVVNIAGAVNLTGAEAYGGTVAMKGYDSRVNVDGDLQAGKISFKLGLQNATFDKQISLISTTGTAEITGMQKGSIVLTFDVDYLNTHMEHGGKFQLFSKGLVYNQGVIQNDQRQLIMLDESELTTNGMITWSKIFLSGQLLTADEGARMTVYTPSGLSTYLGAKEEVVTLESGVQYNLDGYDNYNLTPGTGTLIYKGKLTEAGSGLYVADYADITGRAEDHSAGTVVLSNNGNSYGNGTSISGTTLVVDLSADAGQDMETGRDGDSLNVGVLGTGKVEIVSGTVGGSHLVLQSYGDQTQDGINRYVYGNEFYLSSSSVLEQSGANMQELQGDIVSGVGENVVLNTGSREMKLTGDITQNAGGRLILDSRSVQGSIVLSGSGRTLMSDEGTLGIRGDGAVRVEDGYTIKVKGVELSGGNLVLGNASTMVMGSLGVTGTGLLTLAGGTLQSVTSWNSDVVLMLGTGTNVINTGGANVRLNQGMTGPGGFVKQGTGHLYVYDNTDGNPAGVMDVKQGRLVLLGAPQEKGRSRMAVIASEEYKLNDDLVLSSGKGASLQGKINANGHNVTFGDETHFYLDVTGESGTSGYIRDAGTITIGTGTQLHVTVLDDTWTTENTYAVFSAREDIQGADNLKLVLDEDYAFVNVGLDLGNSKEVGLYLTRKGMTPGGLVNDGTNKGAIHVVVAPLVAAVLDDSTELTGKMKQHMQKVSKMTTTEYQTYLTGMGNSASSFYTALSAQVQDATQHINSVRNRVELINPVMYDDWTQGGIYNVWAGGINHYRDVKSNSEAPGYEMTSWGGELGCAIPLSQTFMIGVGFAYTFTDVQVKDGWGNNDNDTYSVDLFARYRKDALTITGVLTGGFTNTEFHRNQILKDETFRANSSTDGNQFLGTLEAGYDFYLNEEKSWILQPLVNLTAGRAKLDSLSETGDLKNAGLMIGSQSYNMFSAGVGAKIAYQYKNSVSDLPGRVELKAMYVNDMGDVDYKVNGRFIGAPENSFNLDGVSNERSAAIVSAGWVAPISAFGQFFVDAGCEFRKDQNGVNTTIGFSFQF